MNKSIFKFKKNATIFLLMAIVYVYIEVVFTAISGEAHTKFPETARWSMIGYSSIYMSIVGGVVGLILSRLNRVSFVREHLNMFSQSVLGALIITGCEMLAGYILNVRMGFDIWDYSGYPINFMGQISFTRSLLWFAICPFAYWFDDYIRAKIYLEGSSYPLGEAYIHLFFVKAPNMNDFAKSIEEKSKITLERIKKEMKDFHDKTTTQR